MGRLRWVLRYHGQGTSDLRFIEWMEKVSSPITNASIGPTFPNKATREYKEGVVIGLTYSNSLYIQLREWE